jgi:hypothetical protein
LASSSFHLRVGGFLVQEPAGLEDPSTEQKIGQETGPSAAIHDNVSAGQQLDEAERQVNQHVP